MGSTSKADVVIVGGGVVGCMAAYELSQAGLQVTLLERGQLGSEASSASEASWYPFTSRTMEKQTLCSNFTGPRPISLMT